MKPDEARSVRDYSRRIIELLVDTDETTGVTVLANVVALWLAGYQGDDAQSIRDEALKTFLERVIRLTEFNDRMVRDATKQRGH